MRYNVYKTNSQKGQNNMLNLKDIRCCGLKNPLGLDNRKIDFSWKLISDKNDTIQNSYQILVKDEKEGILVWDSGIQLTKEQNSIIYQGAELNSNRYYCYKVIITDNYGEKAESEDQFFTIGLKEHEWKAKWIGCQTSDLNPEVKMASKQDMIDDFKRMITGQPLSPNSKRELEPCKIYRREFDTANDLKECFLSITAHGLYEARINGVKITDSRLNPGFTTYDDYLEYQTYEVSSLIHPGKNVLTIILADGWYRGTFGILGYGNNYGLELALLAQMELAYKNGSQETIVTDESFSYCNTGFVYSDLMIGEKQDKRISTEHLYHADANTSNMKSAEIKDFGFANLHGILCEPVRCTQTIENPSILTSPSGETIVDMGQNIVGGIRLHACGESGTEIKMEFSEVLDKEGNYINNISGFNRDQTDYLILSGKEEDVFETTFTFHGFRYVKITGYPGTLTADKVQGIVIGTDLDAAGTFTTSNEKLNQLQSNIQWSQRGNMLSIPTDCPQREKAGWTGDILVYGKTATFNQNIKQFLKKWLRNMEKEQFEDGLIPVIIPYPLGYNAMQKDAFGTDTSAGWGDAAIVVPWTLYETYKDISILQENFTMMKKWMDYVEKDVSEHMPEYDAPLTPERRERQKYLWNTNFHFGDWLYPSCKNEDGETDMWRSAYTTKELVATALYAQSTRIMSQTCALLENEELAAYYDDLNQKIRQAFAAEYVREDGSIDGAVQGVYVLAIAQEMAEPALLQKMADHLVKMIHENHDCLDTGFMSIKYLIPVLEKTGHSDVAKALLYQENCPSWLYEIKMGATTMWETWNCIKEDGTRTHESYNHYAFGCIGEWMYQTLAGIILTEPGFEKFKIAPSFDYDLTSVSAKYECIYGTIRSEWHLDGSNGTLTAEVPAGTHAEIILPGVHTTVGSGTYTYTFTL